MGNSTSAVKKPVCSPPPPLKLHESTYQAMPRSPGSPHLSITSRDSDIKSDATGTDHEISRPLRRQHVRGLSELIDPCSLVADEDVVKSPSGNLLRSHDFFAREDRPLSLRERQERIRQQMQNSQAYAVNGITSIPKESSPCSSAFPMFDIEEEEQMTIATKPAKKSFLCF